MTYIFSQTTRNGSLSHEGIALAVMAVDIQISVVFQGLYPYPLVYPSIKLLDTFASAPRHEPWIHLRIPHPQLMPKSSQVACDDPKDGRQSLSRSRYRNIDERHDRKESWEEGYRRQPWSIAYGEAWTKCKPDGEKLVTWN